MLERMYLEKYADVLIWALGTSRRNPFAKGDVVLVRFGAAALELAEILYDRLLEMRLNPVLRLVPTTTMEQSFYERSSQKQLMFIPPGEEELTRNISGLISLLAPQSLTHLSGVEPNLFSIVQKSRKSLRDIMDERESAGDFGWTLCLLPTPALAEAAGMSLEEYARQIVEACYLTRAEPERDWKEIWKRVQEIKAWLTSLRAVSYRVQSERTDLTILAGEQRRWLGITGHNIPSFELYTSPDWRGTEGVFYSDLPSYRSGNLIRGVRLEFRAGQVVSAEAEQGMNFAVRQINTDAGARRVGEFSLTDRRFSPIGKFMAHTLYDENFGGECGNCHIAVGSSYADTFAGEPGALTPAEKERLGFNTSALHWDLVNTESKRVTAKLADGRVTTIYEDGRFVL